MKKKKEKVFKKSRLLFWCICSIYFSACKEQPEVYLESYISSEDGETELDSVSEMTVGNHETEVVVDESALQEAESLDISTEQVKLIYVYVCGAVNCPDVYALSEGSRICDAIAKAGGLREDADSMSVNLAQIVYDGQMLRIYTQEEVLAGVNSSKESISGNQSFKEEVTLDDRININTATKHQLMTLPGIGNAKADAILAYRTKQGAFDKIEDLMKIPGIKEGVFEQIKEQIRID